MDPSIGVLDTFDSKLAELLFLRDEIRLNGYRAITINLGTKERPKAEVDFDLYFRIPDLIQSRDQIKVLPLSFPKVMISTVASKDMSRTVATKDITMFHSVFDMLGVTSLSSVLLREA